MAVADAPELAATALRAECPPAASRDMCYEMSSPVTAASLCHPLGKKNVLLIILHRKFGIVNKAKGVAADRTFRFSVLLGCCMARQWRLQCGKINLYTRNFMDQLSACV